MPRSENNEAHGSSNVSAAPAGAAGSGKQLAAPMRGAEGQSVVRRLQSELMVLMMGEDSGVSGFPEGDNIFYWVDTPAPLPPPTRALPTASRSPSPVVEVPFQVPLEEEVYSKDRIIVAVRQGNILATAFHPELTSDSIWHRFFLGMDKESHANAFSELSLSTSSGGAEDGSKHKPLDLPVF